MSATEHCYAPPIGWVCSRETGHEGPCAATPVQPQSWEETARRLQSEKIALHDQLAAVVKALRGLTDGVEGEEWPRWLGHLPWDVREYYKRVVTEARAAVAQEEER